MSDMVRWSLRWGNPTTTPPAGWPKIKLTFLLLAGAACPQEIKDGWVAGGPYAVCFERITQQPIRRWGRAAKARVRRRNLRQRLEKKFPLFADVFEAAELASRPDYYAASDHRETAP